MCLLQSNVYNVYVSDTEAYLRELYIMRIWTRKHAADKTRGRLGPLAYTVLPLSAQQTVDADYILALLNKHVKPDGTVDTIFVEFENERLPVCSEAELPILSKMATLYHNALIAEACKRELDLYNKLPDLEGLEALESMQAFDDSRRRACRDYESFGALQHDHRADRYDTSNTLTSTVTSAIDNQASDASPSTPSSWNEEELGEQRVFDETWEMNADLVPWNLHDAETEERFGSYM